MTKAKKNAEREDRIAMGIIAAHDFIASETDRRGR
jgi:hypothetical protein